MIQDLHTEIDRLKRRIKLCERVTLGSLGRYLCICDSSDYQERHRIAFLDSVCQISKLVFKRKLKQKGAGVTVGMNPFNLSNTFMPCTSFSSYC